MKPSKEQIEAWAREVFGPSAYPLTGAIEMTNLAYAAGRKAGMEEAARRCEVLQREHDRYCAAMGFGYADGITGRECARDIRALAAQEADK